MWTNLRSNGYDLADLTRLMSSAPASLAGLDDRKGKLSPGYHADIVIWRPEKQFTVVPELIHHKHKLTPYAGMELYGQVEATYVRGRVAYENGTFQIVGESIVD
jgi:allantoinase